LPNAQYQSLACAASLLTIQTQQENTFASASMYTMISKPLSDPCLIGLILIDNDLLVELSFL